MASIKLSITEPCHENWNAMLPEDKGRFCLSCQKTVVDFTAMSDRQVFDYFKNYKGDTCGQFSGDQLNRELTKPKTHSIGRWKYFWQMLLPAFFAFQKIGAQPRQMGKVAMKPICKPVTPKPETRLMGMVAPHPITKPSKLIQGSIVSDQQKPVPFATVTASDGKYAVADSLGRFRITLSDKAVLTISQVGYNERTFTIDSLETNNIAGLKLENGQVVIETTIELKQKEILASDVLVEGFIGTVCISSRGGVSVRRASVLHSQKLITPDSTLPQLKIFPNPIHPGQSFQIAFQVKKTGNYLMKIVDATGKVLVESKINMVSKNQTETISGLALQHSGIYFITLTNPADKKSKPLSGRVVIQ